MTPNKGHTQIDRQTKIVVKPRKKRGRKTRQPTITGRESSALLTVVNPPVCTLMVHSAVAHRRGWRKDVRTRPSSLSTAKKRKFVVATPLFWFLSDDNLGHGSEPPLGPITIPDMETG